MKCRFHFQGGGTKLQISLIFQATTGFCLISFPLRWHYQVILFSLTSVRFWWLYFYVRSSLLIKCSVHYKICSDTYLKIHGDGIQVST